ncbi:FAD-binding oxidoreductase [Aquiflexum sp. LQ15W]|uniref:NAD(P)/FAD-dependent oxidoreductase n=1 Tax=Cognataquiflexum nitidum TaxID=2922272 RepID=UPI001F138043|nr:FAD-dependent oxidoreductase [Cognataquiflexum nitidum]MCH6199326.1 FAD-binding oxidoreductase [Cognataquiflexum nitidum]
MEVDFLLIGQGLAGTVLSHRLLQIGKKVMVIDMPFANQSSRVAAGLYNPITGKKMVKSWNTDLLFPEIEPLYTQLEELLDTKFLYKKNIYRPFLNIEEQNEWMGKTGDPGFEPYFEKIFSKEVYPNAVNPFGGILLKNSGYLDINTLLSTYSAYLKEKNLLREGKFEEQLLQIRGTDFRYEDITAQAVVYCNGLGAMNSQFFSDLPFAPVKGEILDLEQDFSPEEIINRGVFRITLPDGIHRVGSTYTWHDMDQGPTENAKKELLEKLEKLVPASVQSIKSHRFGIRPATKDRKPFLGEHPVHSGVYIFNGFGAKGVSLVPYYSKIMVEMLLFGHQPEKEVNIDRFRKT